MSDKKKPIPFSQEVFDEVCNRLADGRSLRKVCADKDMPGKSAFMDWVKKDEALAEQYARAMELRADYIFEETKDIADTATPETVHVARLQVDTRKWYLGKVNPKVYGDRIQTEDITQQPRQLVIVSPKLEGDKTA